MVVLTMPCKRLDLCFSQVLIIMVVVVVVICMSPTCQKVSVAYDVYRTGSLVLYLHPKVETRGSRFVWSPTGISLGVMDLRKTTQQEKVLIPLRQRVPWMTI